MMFNRHSTLAKLQLRFVLTIALFASPFLTGVTAAQTEDHTITVLSTGTATAEANEVSLQLSVVSQEQTATALFVKEEDIVARLKKALTNAGADDVHELPFRLMPNYEYGQQGTRIIGYRLETPIEVTLDDIKDVPRVIDVATQSGASSITMGAFGLSKASNLHDQAIHSAMSHAKTEATSLAKEIGKSLGDVVSVAEMEDAANATPSGGGEEEEEKKHTKASDGAKPSTLSDKVELRVVFQVR